MKPSADDLKTGLALFKLKLDANFPYVAPNVVELTFDSIASKKDAIHAALEYIRLVGGSTTVFQVTEDVTSDSLMVQFSSAPVQKILKMYSDLLQFKLFDGRRTLKEIECVDSDHAKQIMNVVLVLCKFGLYGGYSYDYKTKRLSVF